MISHSSKLLFIHIPKTGGFSIRKIMRNNFNGMYNIEAYPQFTPDLHTLPLGGKYTHMSFCEHQHLNPIITTYRSFAFIRNPWDRVVSEFEWRKQGLPLDSNRSDFKSFKNFIELLRDGWDYNNDDERHVLPQAFFLKDRNGRINITEIGRYENFEFEITRILQTFGLPVLDIPHENKTFRKGHYRDYYTADTMALVGKIYEEDVDHFKFLF